MMHCQASHPALLAGIAALALLVQEEPQEDLEPELPPDPRGVVLICVAGLEPDDLANEDLPHLRALVERGAWTKEAWADPYGDSVASLGAALWGVGAAKSRLAEGALQYANHWNHSCVVGMFEEGRPEVFRVFVSDDPALGGALIAKARANIRSTGSSGAADRSIAVFTDALAQAPTPCFATLVRTHAIPDPELRPKKKERLAALVELDRELGAIVKSIEGRATRAEEGWVIALCGSGAAPEKMRKGDPRMPCAAAPLVLVGDAFPAGEILDTVSLTDIAPTLLAHLDVPFDPGWKLDGRPLLDLGRARLGVNLLINGGAELQAGSEEALEDACVAGWRSSAGTTAILYRETDNWLKPDAPGPRSRGRNFFHGGRRERSHIEQRIDLRPLEGEIASGKVRYRLEGWLGGWRHQTDESILSVEFLDERGKTVRGGGSIGPASPSERRKVSHEDGVPATCLVRFETTGKVSKKARAARVSLEQVRRGGTNNDGYADEIVLVLTRD